MKVKICGLRTYDEAMAAVEYGADMLGFNFYPPSPRYISPQECQRLLTRLQTALQGIGRQVVMVGVFVNAAPTEVSRTLADCGLDLAQLSGDESPELLCELGERAFKVVHLTTPQALEYSLRTYPHRQTPPSWLADTYHPGEYGGTGQIADWSLAKSLAERVPILLAGGLRPDNVRQALQCVHPWGVDVASGVESSPGCKDAHKIAAFIQEVRQYTQER